MTWQNLNSSWREKKPTEKSFIPSVQPPSPTGQKILKSKSPGYRNFIMSGLLSLHLWDDQKSTKISTKIK